MKSEKNLLRFAVMAVFLCSSLLLLNSCQTSEDEFVYRPEQLFTKDSKIVPLLLKAVGSNTDDISSKSSNTESCTEFVYPMTFYAYANDSQDPYGVQINNNEELVAFLTTLTSGQEFFIMYPVTLVDTDGVETVITDYPDLEGVLTLAINACENSDGDDDDNDGDNDDDNDGDNDDDNDDDNNNDNGDDDGDDDNDDDGVVYEFCGNGNNKNKKITICHNGQTICISINAIWGHMAHHADDYYGSCNN